MGVQRAIGKEISIYLYIDISALFNKFLVIFYRIVPMSKTGKYPR